MASKKTLIAVRNLTKTFSRKGQTLIAVDNVSFAIKPGETVGLVGESGSGKTTIGNTIVKLHNATSGQVLLAGTDIAPKRLSKQHRALLRANVQMIFQDPYSSLNEQKNIMNIVAEPLRVLKQDDQMLSDLYRNKAEVDRYFNLTITREIKAHHTAFRLYANETKLRFYNQIIANLETFESTHPTKHADLKSLLALFYRPKVEASTLINDRLLSISESIFKSWATMQANVDNGLFEDEEEHIELRAHRELEAARKATKHSAMFITLEQEYLKLKKMLAAYEHFRTAFFLKTKNLLKTTLAEWKNLCRLRSSKKYYTSDVKEHNIFRIDHFLTKVVLGMLKKTAASPRLVTSDLADQVKSLHGFLRTATVPIFKQTGGDFDRFLTVFNVDGVIQTELQSFVAKSTIPPAEVGKIIFTLFKEDHKELKHGSINELMAELNKLKGALELARKSPPAEAAIEHFAQKKAQYERAQRQLETLYAQTQKAYIAKHEATIHAHDAKIKHQSIALKELLETAKTAFEKHIQTVLAHPKPDAGFSLRIQSWIKSERAKNEAECRALEAAIKHNTKDIAILERFMTTKKTSILLDKQVKTILVRNRVYTTLVKTGLTRAHAYRYPHEFSGGMRQRVSIARAIITKPKLIIADEPISALDLSIQAQIVNLLKSFQKHDNLSMLFIAHDLSMVRYISDRIIIIHRGKIVEYGATQQIFAHPVHPYTKNLIASMPDIKKISKGFKNTNFVPEYRVAYSVFNEPTYHQISKDHFVLASADQLAKWK